jgi:hypothetical protein
MALHFMTALCFLPPLPAFRNAVVLPLKIARGYHQHRSTSILSLGGSTTESLKLKKVDIHTHENGIFTSIDSANSSKFPSPPPQNIRDILQVISKEPLPRWAAKKFGEISMKQTQRKYAIDIAFVEVL